MIKLGYKASAEQFGPSELLEYGVLAEELGLAGVALTLALFLGLIWRSFVSRAPRL